MRINSVGRYGVITLTCIAASAIAWLIDAPAACLIAAVALSVRIGGRRGGMLAAALSAPGYYCVTRLLRHPVQPNSYYFFRFTAFAVLLILVHELAAKKLEADLELKRQKSYLEYGQRLSHTGSFTLNTATGSYFWSEEVYRLTATSPGTTPTLNMIIGLVHPDERERVRSGLRRAIDSETAFEDEHRLLLSTGEVRFVKVTAHPIRNERNELEYVGAVTDVTVNRRAEEELRRSEEKYRDLVQMSLDAIIVVDEFGTVQSSNPAGLQMIGCRPDQVPGFSILETFTSEDRPIYFERMARLKQGDNLRFERTFVRQDATTLPVEVLVVPMRSGLFHAVIRDISERRAAEAALQRSEDRLRLIIDTIPVLAWSTTADGTVDFVSQRWREYTGLLTEAICDEQWMAVVHPDDRQHLQDVWKTALACGMPSQSEARLRAASGEDRWHLFRSVPLRDEYQQILRWYGTITDIEELKQAQEALRASEQNLQLIIDTVPALVWSALPNGELDYVNRRIVDFLGVGNDRLMSQGWTQFLHPDDFEPTLRLWTHAVLSGTRHEVEYRLKCFDGAYRWFHVTGDPLRDSKGQIIRWYGLLTDIEDRRKEAEILHQTQLRLTRATQIATVGEMAASIAHEVNQPLAAVVANAHACQRWLMAQPPNHREANQAVARIIRDSNTAADVVRRVRALFQEAEPIRDRLDVNQLILEVLRLLDTEMVRQGVMVDTYLAEDLPPVMADRVQLQQVVFNLLQNGIESMDHVPLRPKKLVVRSSWEGADAILVEVRDYGAGLKDPDKLFEPFYTTKEKGMGMGLAICRSIIEAYHGRLWATPEDNQGATFRFTLPVEAGVRAAAEAVPSS